MLQPLLNLHRPASSRLLRCNQNTKFSSKGRSSAQFPGLPAGSEGRDPSCPDRKVFLFLLHSLPRPQKSRGLETSSRPEKTKPVHTSGFLQDGITPDDHTGHSTRRLDEIHTSQGHILTYSNSSSFSEISKFFAVGQLHLQFRSLPFRLFTSPRVFSKVLSR